MPESGLACLMRGEINRKTHFLPLLNSFLPLSNVLTPFPSEVVVNDLNPKIEDFC